MAPSPAQALSLECAVAPERRSAPVTTATVLPDPPSEPEPTIVIPDPNPNPEPAPVIPDPNPNPEPAPVIPDPAPESTPLAAG